MSLLPLVLIFVVFYFLLIRPQQNKMKQHREMIENLKKGDQIVTAGGIMGKVVRVERERQHAVRSRSRPTSRSRCVRHTVADLLNKPVPASGNDNRPAAAAAGAGGFLGKLLGKK